MSKYEPLWHYLKQHNKNEYNLSYAELEKILGFNIDHSFLTYKKEAELFGYKVNKISLKNKTITFEKQ